MTDAPVDEWFGCWNVIKTQDEEVEVVALK
jgi:hypothetical protein